MAQATGRRERGAPASDTIDAFTRLSPAIKVGTSYRGADIVATLQRVCRIHGKPTQIRVDNGQVSIGAEK
mgnify:CR=1 FL=1